MHWEEHNERPERGRASFEFPLEEGILSKKNEMQERGRTQPRRSGARMR
jgi:hypothetical protein